MGRGLTSDPAAGFTLIEVLVTVAVLAVLAVGVSLTTGRNDTATGTTPDMAMVQDRYALTQALAVASRQTQGWMVDRKGMRMVRPAKDGWQVSQNTQRWRDRVSVLRRGPGHGPGAPEILFLPNGRSTAFSISFSGGGQCETDGLTGLTCSGG